MQLCAVPTPGSGCGFRLFAKGLPLQVRVVPALLLLCLLQLGCASQPGASGRTSRVVDPWEEFNRTMFAFNMTLDHYLLAPTARAYKTVSPSWLNQRITNFFGNLGDLRSGLNSILQWRWAHAMESLGRFLVNSTLGVAGLFDVASTIHLQKHETDFGKTLARWGVGMGPYLILPFRGPSTLRESLGDVPDYFLWPPNYITNDWVSYGVTGLHLVDKRAGLLGFKKTIIGDPYTFIRQVYLQHLRHQTGNAQPRGGFTQGFEPGEAEW